MFYHQSGERPDPENPGKTVPDGGPKRLFVTSGEAESLQADAHALYVIRTKPEGVSDKDPGGDLMCGEIRGGALDSFRALLSGFYAPALQKHKKWNKAKAEDVADFVQGVAKFGKTLEGVSAALQDGVTLAPPPRRLVNEIELKPAAFAEAAKDAKVAAQIEGVLEEWCRETDKLLKSGSQQSAGRGAEDAGPDTELEYWRSRMAKFNSVEEQLKTPESRLVLGVSTAARSAAHKEWKGIDMRVADAANEAKDNVKYLTTLEKALEPMYASPADPRGILDGVPQLLNNIKMMHTVARYYNSPERMTTLFVKISNQIITQSVEYLTPANNTSLWNEPKPELLEKLELVVRLKEKYQEEYRATRDRLKENPKGRQFDFDHERIFAKIELFTRRLKKLIDMFGTVQQFTTMSEVNTIDGLNGMIKRFFVIADEFKRKPYDLLDYAKNQYDRDFLEFNVNIHDLETQLQDFVNASFENITSTEQALHLLRQFQSILQRESLKKDLDDKYAVIFQNYALDLDAVQKTYEKHKHSPSLPRNAPPVAGDIMWSRQLLRRIEEPMRKFATNEAIMRTKESKRTVKTYNVVAKALVAFETLWLQAWKKSIESSKAGLQATLIVRHPETGNLLVNFDKEIMQLMRETKYLQRMGIEVPESAKMVLLQEEKFKTYYNQLSYALKEYDRVMSTIVPVAKPLLGPHVEDMEKRLEPGMYALTWSSMNIDGYLARIHGGLAKMEDLISKMNDVLDNRVEANLKQVARISLVDLPPDQSFTYEELKSYQTRFIHKQTEDLVVRNVEIERGVADLCELVRNAPRENAEETRLSDDVVAEFRDHYANLMYGAILNATKRAFTAMKKRLGSRSSGGFLFVERPFFDVDVELTYSPAPGPSMNPSLLEIQGAINATAKKILRVSESLPMWGDAGARGRTFFEWTASDKEIVKSVLLLTGSIEGTKMQVMEYVGTFGKFAFLYETELKSVYEAFMATRPTLEGFENELKKYMAVEEEIQRVPPVHNIGAMSIETKPLKQSLMAAAKEWKTQFAKNLHGKGKQQLQDIHDYMRETTMKLNREVEDLEDVRTVMGVLKEIRDREAEIDAIMTPIEEIYALLERYKVEVPKEETQTVSELRAGWGKMKKVAVQVGDDLSRLQVGFKRELISEVKVFVVDAQEFRDDFERNGPTVPGLDPPEAVDRLTKYTQMFEVRRRKWKNYCSGEALFGLPVTQYPELEKTESEIADLTKLYDLYSAVLSTISGYADVLWVDIVQQLEEMKEQVGVFSGRCTKLPRSLKEWPAFGACKETIDNFNKIVPILEGLSSPDMRERHWQDLSGMTDSNLDPIGEEETFKLQNILDADVLAVGGEVEELYLGAGKEAAIEVKLRAIVAEWEVMKFVFAGYKKYGEVILAMATMAEMIEKIEDTQMVLGSMATNRAAAPFIDEVREWIGKLSQTSEIVEKWIGVQNKWMYMEAVFSGGDIVKQLPAEAKRFNTIDKTFMKAVAGVASDSGDPNVLNTCWVEGGEPDKPPEKPPMLKTLEYLDEQLEECQKSLTAFLDTKRALFPRFYFISDPTLLEILSLGSNPQSVTPHFQSGLFDSITDVTFDKVDKTKMLEMFSQQNECVKFEKEVQGLLEPNPVMAIGNIETWLQSLVDGMQEAVRSNCKLAYSAVEEKELEEFLFSTPAQIALLGVQFKWTASMEKALGEAKTNKKAVQEASKEANDMLEQMKKITLKQLGKNDRKNLETVITVHVHQKDTSQDLVKKRVRDPGDFEWAKQCRFYWRDALNTVIISICDVDFEYSYEYLGVKERLVITPLTDICYVTLSQALGMFLGGAPAGPAGTGKTETTKDLGNTLGKFVVVFNCSDQMDYKGMGKIYRGLAQSGLWGCFDEFNRINLDVLSVCAQQVFCVLSAIRERKSEFIFTDGAKVSLDPRVGFFITMNPGYAGRQELPENLKSLFRGVTMMVPNRQIIKTVKLAACGYTDNEIIGKKFFVLYGLCEQQLSKQAHYDFGLRNILSVLRTMGQSKRNAKAEGLSMSEMTLAMRTLRDMNMSKFVAEDVPLFQSLVEDIFPIPPPKKAVFPEVEEAMAQVARENGLQLHPSWLAKCVQLYETYQVRHGIMLVGPTGAGKTAIAETLRGALTLTENEHQIWKMNPKAITAPQMFGLLDAATDDWTDGVFAVLWREAAKEKKKNTWIILDGPVDAIWIENLNTVLDDNKVLTLANGDRVQMSGMMKAMFEPENLNNASPATVSRAGIIYVSETELGWRPLVKSWLEKRRKPEAEILEPFFEHYVDPLCALIRLECKPLMSGIPWLHVSRDFCSVTTLLTLLDGILKRAVEENETHEELHYERIFIYCACWSLGAILTLEDRPKFNAKMVELANGNVPQPWVDPERDTFFEYYVDEGTTQWNAWTDKVPSWEYPSHEEKPKFGKLVIPTLDSVRLETLLQLVSDAGKSSLFVGGPGTAKTTTIKSFMLGKVKPSEEEKERRAQNGEKDWSSKDITFSSLTTPEVFQTTVESSVEKRTGRTYVPPGGGGSCSSWTTSPCPR